MGSKSGGGRRRLDSANPALYDVPTRRPRLTSAALQRTSVAIWFVALLVGTLAAGTSVAAVGAPDWLGRPAAALMMVVFAVGLTHRCGGLLRIWPVLVLVLAVAALTGQTVALLASAALVTAVLGAVLAVMATRPASSIFGSIAEYLLAIGVALSGTLSVAAWNAPVDYQRFNLLVLGASLALIISVVWNLGAGLHGMSKESFWILIGGAALLILLLAYSSFVRTHGSETVINLFIDVVTWTRETFGGIPRPVEVFIGFPALICGVSVRSQRRGGWWILVFAVIGTAVLTSSLVTPSAFPSYIALSTWYSLLMGLIVGLVARHFVMRERSSRAARAIESVSRVEPPRTSPLR